MVVIERARGIGIDGTVKINDTDPLIHGSLLVPGKDVAASARALSLGLRLTGERRIVNILFLI